MKSNKSDPKKQFIEILSDLFKSYPNQDMSLHLAIMLDGINFEGLSDKELVYIIDKYKCEKDLDMTPSYVSKDVQRILEDTDKLFNSISLEDEDEEDWD